MHVSFQKSEEGKVSLGKRKYYLGFLHYKINIADLKSKCILYKHAHTTGQSIIPFEVGVCLISLGSLHHQHLLLLASQYLL